MTDSAPTKQQVLLSRHHPVPKFVDVKAQLTELRPFDDKADVQELAVIEIHLHKALAGLKRVRDPIAASHWFSIIEMIANSILKTKGLITTGPSKEEDQPVVKEPIQTIPKSLLSDPSIAVIERAAISSSNGKNPIQTTMEHLGEW